MTQLMLAEKLNYSDKAVSKWERGESVPDVFMLKTIADLFGVTVDYLLTEDHTEAKKHSVAVSKIVRRNRMFISFLATMLVWLIATVIFVAFKIGDGEFSFPSWLVFIYAIPSSTIVALVFNSIWGIGKLNYLFITIINWSMLASVHLSLLLNVDIDLNVWIIYVIGIPAQVIIFLWSGINNPKKTKSKDKKGRKNASNDATPTSQTADEKDS